MPHDPERRKPTVFVDSSGDSTSARVPEQPPELAGPDARPARQVVTPVRSAPLLSRNGLLLLIAGLAFLVAIGVLTN
jgi:hypothetical protein